MLETTTVCYLLATITYSSRHNHIWFIHGPKSANFPSTFTGSTLNATTLCTLVRAFLFRRQEHKQALVTQDLTRHTTNRKIAHPCCACESVEHLRRSCVCFKLGYLPNGYLSIHTGRFCIDSTCFSNFCQFTRFFWWYLDPSLSSSRVTCCYVSWLNHHQNSLS